MKKTETVENKRKIREKAIEYYKKMLSRLNFQIDERTVGKNNPLKKYIEAYKKEVATLKGTISQNDLFSEIKRNDIVFFGNFRTDPSIKYYLLDILKKLNAEGTDITFGIDLFTHRKKKYLESYLKGEITKGKLSQILNFDSISYSSFLNSYFLLIDYLKSKNIPVIPLDMETVPGNNFDKKDKAIAEKLASFRNISKKSKLICLLPDTWIARNHLPSKFVEALKILGIKSKILRIFSGSEQIYIRLLKDLKEKSCPIIKCRADTYVLNLNHPVARYNSFLNYIDGERELSNLEIRLQFAKILDVINKKFGLGIDINTLNYKLFTNFEIDFIEVVLKSKSLNEDDKNSILEYVLRGEGFFIPRGQIIYLGNLSKLHAAEEAGHYLRNVLAGIERPKTHEDKFYISVVNEALAFMASKLIVPLRTPIETNIIKMAFTPFLFDGEKENLMIHSLGYSLGDKLYKKFKKGKLSKKSIKGIFVKKFSRQGEGKRYYSILENIAEK